MGVREGKLRLGDFPASEERLRALYLARVGESLGRQGSYLKRTLLAQWKSTEQVRTRLKTAGEEVSRSTHSQSVAQDARLIREIKMRSRRYLSCAETVGKRGVEGL